VSAPGHHPLAGQRGEQLGLFDGGDGAAEPSARRRRRIHLVKLGRHPATLWLRQAFSAGLALHPQAPRQIDARPSPFTCGSCAWCQPLDLMGQDFDPKTGEDMAHPARLIWKCWRWPEKVTRGDLTTIRLMWPACVRWTPAVIDPPRRSEGGEAPEQ